MNFLLVKPCPHKNSINLQSFMLCEPLELEYVAALLERRGHKADIVDLVIDKNFKKAFRAKQYDVVAFTSYQIHVAIVKRYAAYVKKCNRNVLTMVGGVHAEVVPSDFEDENIDIILQGGMYALEAVAKGLEENVAFSELKELGKMPKQTVFDFPHPDRSKTERYRKHYNYIYHDQCATIKTSFSCPYNCEFCFCTRLGNYFERDLNDVIAELREIKESNIFIVDDNFLFRRERVLEFCRLLDENNIKKTYIAFGRADFIAENEDLIKLLSEHGFDAFFVGIESFKRGELDNYQKRTSVEINEKAVRILEKYNVQCYSGLIVGYDWTREDFNGLISYLNSFEHPMSNIQPITPIKGTSLYEKLKNKLTVDESKYQYFDMAHLVMQPEKMSKRAFYYQILRAYFKTSASKKGRRYIVERYGKKIYRRVRKGAYKIAMQYIKLMIKPN